MPPMVLSSKPVSIGLRWGIKLLRYFSMCQGLITLLWALDTFGMVTTLCVIYLISSRHLCSIISKFSLHRIPLWPKTKLYMPILWLPKNGLCQNNMLFVRKISRLQTSKRLWFSWLMTRCQVVMASPMNFTTPSMRILVLTCIRSTWKPTTLILSEAL